MKECPDVDKRFLDPDEVRRLLVGHEDILTPLVKKEETFRRHVPCPTCGSYGHQSTLNAKQPFSPGKLLPNVLLVCTCGTEFEPNSGIIVKVGETRRVINDE